MKKNIIIRTRKRKKRNLIKGIASSEIFILVVAIVAFAFILGGSSSAVALGGVRSAAALREWGSTAGHSSQTTGIGAGAQTTAVAKGLGMAVVWAAGAYAAGRIIGAFFFPSKSMEWKKSFATASAGATFTYFASRATGLHTWIGSQLGLGSLLTSLVPWVFAAYAFYELFNYYKKTKHKTFVFSCLPYSAPKGGRDCKRCNEDPLRPCTEYRCKALGQSCVLLNKETPGREKCFFNNSKDSSSPKINTTSVLPEGLRYSPDPGLRPGMTGVIISKGGGCLDAFTRLQFEFTTNEPAQCKIDFNASVKFDDMQFYVGEDIVNDYNHTQTMKMPGSDTITAITAEGGSPILKNDGTMQLFIRCSDANGNYNRDAFSVKFCVSKSPDYSPPSIEGTDVISESFAQYNADKFPIEVYVNEPAECRWSLSDKAYEQMENPMSCATDEGELNAVLSYTCSGNLTGVKNNVENKYYFMCKDKPDKPDSERNVMPTSYAYTLKGSQPLNIIKVSPNETITGSTTNVAVDLEVETANGAEEGKAWCSFSPDVTPLDYTLMSETESYAHKQPKLQLTADEYTYYFKCIDAGGNIANASVKFKVFSDRTAPKITSIYKDEFRLKVVTSEDAECVYSLSGCNYEFGSGLPAEYLNPSMKRNSYLEWKPNTIYYVKCRDFYGNGPEGECSVTIKPVESTKTV